MDIWLENLNNYWLNKNVDSIVNDLFEKDVVYYETPFVKVNDITAVWNDILDQNIINLKYKIMDIKGNAVVANYIMELDTGYVCDMVYEIELNSNNKCIYFKQWYMGENK